MVARSAPRRALEKEGSKAPRLQGKLTCFSYSFWTEVLLLLITHYSLLIEANPN
ncbi:MAG: hypothetical protein F6K47_23480 [Symploca sp. SIO2E6]|nr:hypothetical protein [Symploca sp. SIO2E6]